MKLVDFLTPEAVQLDLGAASRDEALAEMVALLRLQRRAEDMLVHLLRKREAVGSTGIGSGVAIPHVRALAIDRLRVAFGRKESGIDFGAVDGKPVRYVFLIVAPPIEVSNLYLPVLGRIAQFCKSSENLRRLAAVRSPEELLQLVRSAEP